MLQKIFVVLGGDNRQLSVITHLCGVAAEVRVFGLPGEKVPKRAVLYGDWKEAVRGADVILLPLPATPDGVRVSFPLLPELPALFLEALWQEAPEGAEIFGGKLSPAVKERAREFGRELRDYCESEELLCKNAIPTAEGAVEILMRRSERTVCGMSVAVTGYGRVAKALARLLLGMGAQVTVGARKQSALAEALEKGCQTVLLSDASALAELCKGKDAIFNTVPHWIFGKDVLKTLSKGQILVDLASAPGGVDAEAARALEFPVIWALSLPGRYAPQTAGEIIAQSVLSALEEEGTP